MPNGAFERWDYAASFHIDYPDCVIHWQLPDYILLSASKSQIFKCLGTFPSDWDLKRYFILFVFVSLKVIQSMTLGRYSSAFCLGEIHEISQILWFNHSGPYRNSEWKSGLLEF